MKRISSLLLAAVLTLGGMGAAHAIDVKVKGSWDFVFGWAENTNFMDNQRANRRGERNDDNFAARQRIRTQVNFIASENLQGVLMFEIGITDWGHSTSNNQGSRAGGALDADGVNIKTKRAYLDWMVPETSLAIRMGIQGLSLPMATGYNSPVFSADVAAVVANYKFDDMFAITAFWARPFNQYLNDRESGSNRNLDDETDMFGLVLPITLDGWTITPWGVWSRVGSASGFYEYVVGDGYGLGDNGARYTQNNTATAWWAGLGVSVDIWDPLTFAIDGMYGHLQNQKVYNDAWLIDEDGRIGAAGWFVTATLDYKLDWGTPGLFGWWSTGDTTKGINAHELGRMPVLGLDDGFNPTSFGFAGATSSVMNDRTISASGMGTWGVGLQFADLSFIEDLSHTIRVAYIQGTNEHEIIKDKGYDGRRLRLNTDGVYLTDKDHAIEVNFDHKYQIYENLAAYLELGYINLDLDSSTWNNTNWGHKTDDAWKAQVLLRYQF